MKPQWEFPYFWCVTPYCGQKMAKEGGGLKSGDCKRYLYLSYTASSVGFVVTIYKDSAKFRLSKEKAKNFSFKGQKETGTVF